MFQPSEIKSKIHKAFAGVKRLPDSAMFLDEYDYLWTESFIGGKEEWQQLPSDAISHECSALASVTPLGFQFLIPAYICWVLENVNSSSNTPDYVIYGLNASTRPLALFEELTIEQSEAICIFLIWAVEQKNSLDSGEAVKSLNSYWNRFKNR